MKVKHFLSSVLAASMLIATVADAGSIGRSGGSSGGGGRSSFSSSSSSHSSSVSAPSKPSPSVAPAPSKPGGIGGTQSSVGVRKSEVTQPVANKVQDSKSTSTASTGSTSTTSSSSGYSSPPVGSYGYSNPPPVVVHQSSGFGSSFAGALGGTIVGNALFGNHGNGGGTTVINNGTPSGGTVSSNQMPQTVQSDGSVVTSNVAVQPQEKKESFGMWSFMWNVITFAILVAVLVGIAWAFYKGFKMVKGYVDKERGVGPAQPFNPTQQFWRIQRAFAEADITELKVLLGPDMVDEMTNGLTASTITLHNVSHEVRLNTPREFSVWYQFEDDGTEANQVWHYEKFGTQWQLNGIENV